VKTNLFNWSGIGLLHAFFTCAAFTHRHRRAGFVFGREVAQNRIVDTIAEIVGVQTAVPFRPCWTALADVRARFFATALGTVLLLVGAGGVVGQLQDSLNTIWGVAPKTGRGMFGFLKDRFVSYSLVLGVGFLLLVSLVISTG